MYHQPPRQPDPRPVPDPAVTRHARQASRIVLAGEKEDYDMTNLNDRAEYTTVQGYLDR